MYICTCINVTHKIRINKETNISTYTHKHTCIYTHAHIHTCNYTKSTASYNEQSLKLSIHVCSIESSLCCGRLENISFVNNRANYGCLQVYI